MMLEKTCYNCGTPITKEYCEKWPVVCEHWTAKPTPTNAEHIRSMSDEELAEVIYNGISSDPCDYCKRNNLHCDGSPCRGNAHTEIIVEWLQQPKECAQ